MKRSRIFKTSGGNFPTAIKEKGKMAQSYKEPPVLSPDSCYEEWKKKLQLWSLVTPLKANQQGPAVYLTLTGIAEKAVVNLKIDNLKTDNGLQLIIDKLDLAFLGDANARTFLAFKRFAEYKRQSGATITDFLVEYEMLYSKLAEFQITLPEGVQAYFLLCAANVSEEKESLIRTTCGDFTYDNMKNTIKMAFNDFSTSSENAPPAIKTEPVFSSNHFNRGRGRGMSRGRGDYQGRGRGDYQSRGRGDYQGRGRGPGRGRFSNNRSNPTDAEGNVLRCFRCGSSKHFSRECRANLSEKDSSNNNKNEESFISITLNASQVPLNELMCDTVGMGILDTACTKTVAGKQWMEAYLDSLTDQDKDLVTISETTTNFCFGDGNAVKGLNCVKFPAVIGNKKVFFNANVVDSEIPLLISKQSMKKAGLKLDCSNDMAEMLGEKVKLKISKSGHYLVPLSKMIIHDEHPKIVLYTSNLKNCNSAEKRVKAVKLHRQLCHASKEKLVKLVKESADFADEEFISLIKKVCDECEICAKFKRPPLRPVVGLRLGNKFNHVVALDLKEHIHNKVWILHLIDLFTRYSAACLISDKKASTIVSNVCNIWITRFGAPTKFLSDNGGEFSNDMFRELNEKFNIETATTAAESPFSNGVCERHHLVLVEAMKKTMIDENCTAEIALAYATAAKNSLSNQGGYSPNQLVFGFNPNTPSVLHDSLPALNNECSSEIVRKNLNANFSARQNYIQAESSERIQWALRHKTRTYADENYEIGEKVFYRRKNFKGWKGPAVVLGKDEKFILIRHGGGHYRVHPCHLMKVNKRNQKEDTEKGNSNSNNKPTMMKYSSKTSNSEENGDSEEIGDSEENGDSEYKKGIIKPMKNDYVKYKLKNSEEWFEVKVQSYGGKKTGKGCRNQSWINVKSGNDQWGVNWDHVELWKKIEEHEQVLLINSENKMSQEVIDAKEREIENMISNDVFEEVPYEGQKCVSSR